MNINCFSKEVSAELGYYVYRLLDLEMGVHSMLEKGKRIESSLMLIKH